MAAEKIKPENGKGFVQPITVKTNDVFKNNDIDRATQFGGTIGGNGARNLM